MKKLIPMVMLACICLFVACESPSQSNQSQQSEKITFDLSELNDQGLYGPPDGLRSLSYEFCIPMDKAKIEEVQKIDSTLGLQAGSPGRIGCSDLEILCIGETHQDNFRQVLEQLAALEYIKKIDQTFFE